MQAILTKKTATASNREKKGRIGGSAFDTSGNYEPWETGARGDTQTDTNGSYCRHPTPYMLVPPTNLSGYVVLDSLVTEVTFSSESWVL